MAYMSVTPPLGRLKTGGSWSLLVSESSQISEPEPSESRCLKAVPQRAVEEDIKVLLRRGAGERLHMHVHSDVTHMHSQSNYTSSHANE